ERRRTPLEIAREINKSLTIRKSLFAVSPERNPWKRASPFEEHRDRLRDRTMVAPEMKPAQKLKGVRHLHGHGIQRLAVDPAAWIEPLGSRCTTAAVHLLTEGKQRFIAERKERAAQRCEHLQLVLGPLDRSQRVAKRDHFFPV